MLKNEILDVILNLELKEYLNQTIVKRNKTYKKHKKIWIYLSFQNKKISLGDRK